MKMNACQEDLINFPYKLTNIVGLVFATYLNKRQISVFLNYNSLKKKLIANC